MEILCCHCDPPVSTLGIFLWCMSYVISYVSALIIFTCIIFQLIREFEDVVAGVREEKNDLEVELEV